MGFGSLVLITVKFCHQGHLRYCFKSGLEDHFCTVPEGSLFRGTVGVEKKEDCFKASQIRVFMAEVFNIG